VPVPLTSALPSRPPVRAADGPSADRQPTDRQAHRQAVTDHLLTALEDLVWRYRAQAGHPEHAELHAEVLTAEVAFQLAVARRALHRHPLLDPR
jgi:hypothetical protein